MESICASAFRTRRRMVQAAKARMSFKWQIRSATCITRRRPSPCVLGSTQKGKNTPMVKGEGLLQRNIIYNFVWRCIHLLSFIFIYIKTKTKTSFFFWFCWMWACQSGRSLILKKQHMTFSSNIFVCQHGLWNWTPQVERVHWKLHGRETAHHRTHLVLLKRKQLRVFMEMRYESFQTVGCKRTDTFWSLKTNMWTLISERDSNPFNKCYKWNHF